MSFSLNALHAQFIQSTRSYSFTAGYRAMHREVDALAPFSAPEALLATLHGHAATPGEKNCVLRALLALAREIGGRGNVATTLILLALWPGLEAAHARLRDLDDDGSSSLAADLTSRVCLEIARIDLDKVEWVAATILRNVRRDILRDRCGLHEISVGPIGDEIDPAAPLPSAPDVVSDRQEATRVQAALGTDGPLVSLVAGEGHTLAEAAVVLGISREAAKKRYQRARARARVTRG